MLDIKKTKLVKSVSNHNTNNNTRSKTKYIQRVILILIIFFVLYNFIIVNIHDSNDTSKENALKLIKEYVLRLEQDVSDFQTIIENKIKSQNNVIDNDYIDIKTGKSLRGIVENVGLNITKNNYDNDKITEGNFKKTTSWTSRIINLFKFTTYYSLYNKKSKIIIDDDGVKTWSQEIKRKLTCLHARKGSIYFYHVRKAAGSSIKDVLDFAAKRFRVKLLFTEGKTIDERLLDPNGIFKVISFREPTARITSLFWYEHVSWYATVKKEPNKIFLFSEWFDSWCDGSEWKTTFITKNPGNVYVEVENYYTKLLSGWQGPEPVSRKHLDIAKKNLEKFELILIQEWMADISQVNAVTELFPGRLNIAAASKVKGDKDLRKRYEKQYAPDMPALLEKMKILNIYDIELYEFAKFLSAKRFQSLSGIVKELENHVPAKNAECSTFMDRGLTSKIGLFRPFGHKGPFKQSIDD